MTTSGSITITENVYHRASPGESASGDAFAFVRKLESDDQPYGPRTMKIGEVWQPLSFGWLEDGVGLILLENKEGIKSFIQVRPTPEQLAEALDKIIEIGFCTEDVEPAFPAMLLLPGEPQRLTPALTSKVWLRCRHGEAKCLVTLYPK